MHLTSAQLVAAVMGCTAANATKFVAPINEAFDRYEIGKTPLRVAHFLAQVGHESGGLAAVKEYASGAAYEGRADLGNVTKGDGVKYKGRGLMQITGRTNYRAVSQAFGVDFITYPEKLELPEYAALAAGWYWKTRNINAVCDMDTGAWNPQDKSIFVRVTKLINGGINGMSDREARFIHARKALGFPAPLRTPPVKPAAPERAL
jgi:putative chitinase